MHTIFDVFIIGTLVVCIGGCSSEPQPRQPSSTTIDTAPATAVPAPFVFPEPPALTGASSDCAVRRYHRKVKEWRVARWQYEPEQRTLQSDWLHFDAEGRLIKRVDSDSTTSRAYDAQGNLHEELDWDGDKLHSGTRWRHRYEGKPLKLVATDIFDLSTPKQRNRPHTHVRYTYDDSGRVDRVIKERGSKTELYRYVWKDDRIVAQYDALGALDGDSKVPYHVGRTYEYDAHGKITKFTIDGMVPAREGAPADGTTDHVTTFHYDSAGHLERMEGDGWGGDVAPEDADGKPDQITLLTPPCDPIVKLVPHVFGFPELHLPNSVAPPLR